MKKWIKSALVFTVGGFIGIVSGAWIIEKIIGKVEKEKQELSEKHLALFLLMNQWVIAKQEGKSLIDFFQRNNFKQIAIYGMSYAGERLLDELSGSDIEVKYGIDQNASGIYASIDLYTLDDELPEVDAIVVTPIYFFDQIEEKLLEKVKCPIVSLEDILYEV